MPAQDKASTPASHDQVLADIERKLLTRANDIALLCDKAQLLTELGRYSEARDLYLRVLRAQPTSFRALTNLGTLLYETGYRSAARTAYAEAVARHPGQATAQVNLANILRENGENNAALMHYERALALEPENASAHRGLAYIFKDRGDEEKARLHQARGFADRRPLVLPYQGTRRPVHAVQVISANGGNLPIQSYLDRRVFHVTVIPAEFTDPDIALPPHDVFINAIGDADLCAEGLAAAARLAAKTSARIVNHPAAVMATGRAANAERLRGIEDVIVPRVRSFSRHELTVGLLGQEGFGFPLLLRAPGFHGGRHFVQVTAEVDLPSAVAALPGRELIAIQFLDARSTDGKIRKYRIMMIGGRLYPLHLAISAHWKIHYFSAEMAERPEHRAEDEAFLGDMARVLGPRAMDALGAIARRLELDYGGVDFSLGRNGEVLLYEANATMTVPLPDSDARWDYRKPAVARIHDAIAALLTGRAP